MIRAKVGFTFEELPESHPLHDFDGQFYIRANVDPGCRATYSHPGDPPEVEILGCDLVSSQHAATSFDIEETEKMEAALLSLIDVDEKVRGNVYEALWESYQESRTLRCED